MKAKLINESLRDKLVAPTKEDIDNRFVNEYGQDTIKFILELLNNLTLVKKTKYITNYVLDGKVYMKDHKDYHIFFINGDLLWYPMIVKYGNSWDKTKSFFIYIVKYIFEKEGYDVSPFKAIKN